jgi:hypothetical protein
MSLPEGGDPWAEGWTQAVKLRQALLDGHPLPTLPYVPMRLEQGEVAHARVGVEYARFYSTNVSYRQSNGFFFGSPAFVVTGLAVNAIGNAAARSRAQAMAAAQWRERQGVDAYLTDRRILTCVASHRWLSFWHQGIIEAAPMLEHWSLLETFQQGDPVRWTGPAAAWLAVAVIHLAYGDDQLAHHPGLAALAPSSLPGGPSAGTEHGGYEFPG